MKKLPVLLLCALIGSGLVAGCGKQSPLAPKSGGSAESGKSAQIFKPSGVFYSGVFNGTVGIKPWYWFDADDNPGFNARIRTNQNYNAYITRVNENTTWGKVRTFAISHSNTANATVNLRIYVPTKSSSVSWKILVQEEGGQWRNWVLQNSTSDTGYKTYNFTSLLQAVNAGSGAFSLELVVEGDIYQYIEVGELYLYDTTVPPAPGEIYWYDNRFGYTNNHTVGWFDETTNPGFHAVISNLWGNAKIAGDPALGGKVMSPVITWDPQRCQTLFVGMTDPSACFSVWIQEQSGQYRQWQVPRSAYNATLHGFTFDLRTVTGLAAGAPFSVTLSDIFGTIYIVNIIKIY